MSEKSGKGGGRSTKSIVIGVLLVLLLIVSIQNTAGGATDPMM